MNVTMMWHGGSGYSAPTMEDAEQFPSLKAAKDEFASRVYDPYYPCVTQDTQDNGGPSAWVFFGTEAGDYPDRLLSFGPRGAVVCERA
jgi:hypothetical protein